MPSRASLLAVLLFSAAVGAFACRGETSPPGPSAASTGRRSASAARAEAPGPDGVARALEAEMARYPERYAKEPFPLVSVGEVERLLERKADLLIVDARDPSSYARGHLPGAVNIPFGNWLEEGKPLPPRDRDLIVYCNNQDCPISRLWSEQAAQRGYTRVRHMKAGLAGWKDAGLPVETGPDDSAGTAAARPSGSPAAPAAPADPQAARGPAPPAS
jgi:rhodanese-related sulfurtransferase